MFRQQDFKLSEAVVQAAGGGPFLLGAQARHFCS
jgi:hypothetical protein